MLFDRAARSDTREAQCLITVQQLGRSLAVFAICMCLGSIAAAGEISGRKKSEPCLHCHMLGEGGLIPFIRGQPRAYLIAQIQAYRDRRRTLLEMVFVADTLNDNEINEIAGYISGLKLGPHVAVDATLAKAGRQQLRTLHCQSCHGTGYRGEGAVARLAGQSPAYTAWEIRLIRSGSRHHPAGKPQTELKAMPEETIDAVANALGGMN